MFKQLVSSKLLSSRVDADFYQPIYIDAELKIKKSKYRTLEELTHFVRKGVFDMPSSLYCEEGVPFLRISDFYGQSININRSIKIPKWKHLEEPKTTLRGGDLVLSKVGTTGKVAKIPLGKEVNISQNLVGISIIKNLIDSDYLLAAFASSYLALSIERHVTTAVQGKLTLDILRELPIPIFSKSVQSYIGEKIRHAELLSEWAKQLFTQANDEFEESIFWDPRVVEKVKYGRISPKKLENRLDHRFNSIEKFKAIDLLVENDIKLEQLENVYSITAMVGWKGLTTDHYVDDGPWLLRGVEFSDGVIDFDNLVMVERGKYLEQPQIHLKEGDVALSKDGTIGKAIVIPEINREFAVGSTIARLRKIDETLDPYYLEHCLNHDFLQVQIESYATGVAQPHITQEWIAKLLIPRVANEQEISTLIYKHHLAMNLAKALTNSSKRLVEALIEGQITENQLIEAQQALETGDNTKDRAILSKLSDKGYLAEDGKLLFSDLDKLYELLDEAKQAVDTREESA
ncbi:EcoKI restriction-modification system protein HsdS [Pseudoalteromonas sp. P1-13-1a]|uniref:restriction endonuclease subunit S n=1 Tax=Pseudoalteromonas sp. P1-13-1a TaxID=1723756 RepID=UPI0006D66A6A|nr:restriction endonuclease subunit S [Pseudoalteromonas sp. P1-13-1a]KPZ55751.1 EcoKI restriction-modification system protein HsdS [Pseudoalteromonas sp. P1-13-1a]